MASDKNATSYKDNNVKKRSKKKKFQEKHERENTGTNLEKNICNYDDKPKRNFKRNDKLSKQNELTKKSIQELLRI